MASEPPDQEDAMGSTDTVALSREQVDEILDRAKLRQAKWPSTAPDQAALRRLIHALARDRKVGFLDHSLERLIERGFDVFDVYRVLEKGRFAGGIEAGANTDEWKVKLVNEMPDRSRLMGVATIIVGTRRLLIKTVEWEDR